MTSPFARVVRDRGLVRRGRVGGVLIHSTGRGLLDSAKKRGLTPDAEAERLYGGALSTFPHYVVGHAAVTSYCDELKWAAHASWSLAEKSRYAEGGWRALIEPDGRAVPSRAGTYDWWDARWGPARGLAYGSPADMLAQIGGAKSPNAVYVGIELVPYADGSFSSTQYVALGALVRDVLGRNSFTLPLPSSLPQVWLCGHSDISPLRRTEVNGRPYDPDSTGAGPDFDWRALEAAILAPRGVA